ncbi:MAG: V-type ATP synthase subunit E [Spirochaetales bacterium]|nr:V-type ATP synthase subunit E [Spirochaetales bacterium]
MNKTVKKETGAPDLSSGTDLQLLDQIIREAEAEAKRIVEEAEAQAAKKLENARTQKASIIREAEERADAQADSFSRQKEAALKIELKKRDLQAQEQVYALVMEKTAGLLEKMAGTPEYSRFLMQLVVEGALGLGTEEVEIRTSSAEQKQMSKKLLDDAVRLINKLSGETVKLTLSPKTIDGRGVLLSDREGRLVFNNQIRARLDRRQGEIRRLIAGEIDFSFDRKGASA